MQHSVRPHAAQADIARYKDIARQVLPFVGDTITLINDAYEAGKRILVEGANATMLDVDFGTYPFVTSSNPSIGGVASGLGLAPTKFQAVIGVVRTPPLPAVPHRARACTGGAGDTAAFQAWCSF
jgi:adenylosuccinate synthase